MTTEATETAAQRVSTREFAALVREKLELDERLNTVRKRIEDNQEQMLEFFADSGRELERVQAERSGPDADTLREIRDLLVTTQQSSERDAALELINNALASQRITLYVGSQIWANAKEGMTEQAVAALKANGLERYVNERFNVSTLSSYARELDRNGESFPQAVLEFMDVKPKVQILGRRT